MKQISHLQKALLVLIIALFLSCLVNVGPAKAEGQAQVYWPRPDLKLNSKVMVSGKIPGYARPVFLQRQVPGGWVNFSSTKTVYGKFTLRLPTKTLGNFKLRIVSPTFLDNPAVTINYDKRFKVNAPWRLRGKVSSVNYIDNDYKARWNPCETINYRVSVNRAPRGALREVKIAVHKIEQASGLKFKYLGKSNTIPNGSYEQSYGANVDLLISWATNKQANKIYKGDAIAFASPFIYHSNVNMANQPTGLIDKAYIIYNTKYNNYEPAHFTRRKVREKVLMHELGHAVGLGHVKDGSQMMAERNNETPATWGRGDLAGLQRVGFTQGCISWN